MSNLDDKYFDDLANIDDTVLEIIANNTLDLLKNTRNKSKTSSQQSQKQ
jgi:hypothetical protein